MPSLKSAQAQKRIRPNMDERQMVRQITSLQARMNRMEALMQQLLLTLTSSNAHVDQYRQMQAMLQNLRGDSDTYAAGAAAGNLGAQERPEIAAIRQELLAGNRLKAIQLYRELYGVSVQEAKNALDKM